jgi:DNA-3-methyladenine glycosylase II
LRLEPLIGAAIIIGVFALAAYGRLEGDPEPADILQNRLSVFVFTARSIEVFHADKQAASERLLGPLIQERRIGVSEVQPPIRGRSEAQDGTSRGQGHDETAKTGARYMSANVGKKGRVGKPRVAAGAKSGRRSTANGRNIKKALLTAKSGRKSRRRPAKKARIVYHPGPPIDSEEALKAAIEGLVAVDPEVAGRLVAEAGHPPLRRREAGLAGLVQIIVAQQVSTASATAIFKRLEAGLTPISARAILAATDADLRGFGLSLAKMRALRALGTAIGDATLDLSALPAMTAEEAHRALVAVKGIGPWTADVFLLFCLGHPDAFPAGDLALQEAARLALRLKRRPDASALQKIAERWRPYRAVAARLLWAYYRRTRRGREGMALAGA